MQSGWRIGSIFGIPLLIDPSWFLILGLITFSYSSVYGRQFSNWGGSTAFLVGFATALLLFLSVLLHELGHSLVARTQGIRVNSITLFLFGGVASIDEESKTPGQAFQVAIAGPLVSFALGALMVWGGRFLEAKTPLEVILTNLGQINLILGLFNLIPGLPLDGGQVLRALVWQLTGDRFQGTRWAARSGKILGWTAMFFGIYAFVRFGSSGGLWIALLGWFGVRNADAYDRMTSLQEALSRLQASDAMVRDYRVIDADLPLRQFAEMVLLEADAPPVFYASSDGRYRGLISLDTIRAIERSRWDRLTVQDVLTPMDQLSSLPEKSPLVEVIQRLDAENLPRITVVTPTGAVAGTIDRGDIVRAIAQKLRLPISDADIRRIKAEGTYPPGFPVSNLAQSMAASRPTS
jgi:Zn-dependent protease